MQQFHKEITDKINQPTSKPESGETREQHIARDMRLISMHRTNAEISRGDEKAVDKLKDILRADTRISDRIDQVGLSKVFTEEREFAQTNLDVARKLKQRGYPNDWSDSSKQQAFADRFLAVQMEYDRIRDLPQSSLDQVVRSQEGQKALSEAIVKFRVLNENLFKYTKQMLQYNIKKQIQLSTENTNRTVESSYGYSNSDISEQAFDVEEAYQREHERNQELEKSRVRANEYLNGENNLENLKSGLSKLEELEKANKRASEFDKLLEESPEKLRSDLKAEMESTTSKYDIFMKYLQKADIEEHSGQLTEDDKRLLKASQMRVRESNVQGVLRAYPNNPLE